MERASVRVLFTVGSLRWLALWARPSGLKENQVSSLRSAKPIQNARLQPKVAALEEFPDDSFAADQSTAKRHGREHWQERLQTNPVGRARQSHQHDTHELVFKEKPRGQLNHGLPQVGGDMVAAWDRLGGRI